MSIFKKVFSQQIGIDLGTSNTLIYLGDKGIVLREPSVIAIDDETKSTFRVGEEARAIIGRAPAGVTTTRPLKDGVITDLRCAAMMLDEFIRRVAGGKPMKPEIAIAVPAGVTSVEKGAVHKAVRSGAGQVYLPEEPMAAAIGAGLPVVEPTGLMIVDIGAGTTEVAVISLCGIVVNESVRVAGDELNDAIVHYMKKVHSLAIGERTAEEIKFRLGSAFKTPDNDKYEVKGLNLITGLPRTATISRGEVREALSDPLQIIVSAVKRTLERTPPELAADIYNRGIVLTGGTALLRGLDELIANETEVPVFIAEDPLSCVALGTGRMLMNEAYSRVLEQSLFQG